MSASNIRIRKTKQKIAANSILVDNFLSDMQKYSSLYFFSCKDIRKYIIDKIAKSANWEKSKFWYCNNRIFQRAIAVSLQTEEKNWKDLKQLSAVAKGHTGCLFTNRSKKNVEKFFNRFFAWDVPHQGYKVEEDIVLNRGPLPQFQPEIEPYLRQLGLPTSVRHGHVMLMESCEVCKKGAILTQEQINLLKLLGQNISLYRLRLKCRWSKKTGLITYPNFDDSDYYEDEELQFAQS